MYAAGVSLECVNSNMTIKTKEKIKRKLNQTEFILKKSSRVWMNTLDNRKMFFQVLFTSYNKEINSITHTANYLQHIYKKKSLVFCRCVDGWMACCPAADVLGCSSSSPL